MGPVFLSLPVDLQMEVCSGLDLTPPRVPDRRVRPSCEALRQAAEVLASARNPVILAGSRVMEADAVSQLVSVAEMLGAPVYAECATSHGRLPMPSAHPLYGGGLPLWSPDIRKRLEGFDVALVTGMSLLRTYIYHEPALPLPEELRLVQLDEDPWQLGKTYPVEVGMIGETQADLAELHRYLKETQTLAQAAAAAARREQYRRQHRAVRAELARKIEDQASIMPITPLAMMGAPPPRCCRQRRCRGGSHHDHQHRARKAWGH